MALKHKKMSSLKVTRRKTPKLWLGGHRKDLNLNWKQAKRKYPRLNPYHDSDFDGTLNSKDCRPFNPAKDGIISDWLEKRRFEKGLKKAVEKGKYEREVQPWREAFKKRKTEITEEKREKSRQVLKSFTKARAWAAKQRKELERMEKKSVAGRFVRKAEVGKIPRYGIGSAIYGIAKMATPKAATTEKVKRYATAGRPRASYKHRDPRTGEPIPAPIYYSIMRKLKTQTKTTAEQARIREQIAMAKRGIPPQLTKARQEARIQEAAEEVIEATEGPQEAPEMPQEAPEQRIMPQQVIRQVPTTEGVYRIQPGQVPVAPPGYRIIRGMMNSNTYKLEMIKPPEAWIAQRFERRLE